MSLSRRNRPKTDDLDPDNPQVDVTPQVEALNGPISGFEPLDDILAVPSSALWSPTEIAAKSSRNPAFSSSFSSGPQHTSHTQKDPTPVSSTKIEINTSTDTLHDIHDYTASLSHAPPSSASPGGGMSLKKRLEEYGKNIGRVAGGSNRTRPRLTPFSPYSKTKPEGYVNKLPSVFHQLPIQSRPSGQRNESAVLPLVSDAVRKGKRVMSDGKMEQLCEGGQFTEHHAQPLHSSRGTSAPPAVVIASLPATPFEVSSQVDEATSSSPAASSASFFLGSPTPEVQASPQTARSERQDRPGTRRAPTLPTVDEEDLPMVLCIDCRFQWECPYCQFGDREDASTLPGGEQSGEGDLGQHDRAHHTSESGARLRGSGWSGARGVGWCRFCERKSECPECRAVHQFRSAWRRESESERVNGVREVEGNEAPTIRVLDLLSRLDPNTPSYQGDARHALRSILTRLQDAAASSTTANPSSSSSSSSPPVDTSKSFTLPNGPPLAEGIPLSVEQSLSLIFTCLENLFHDRLGGTGRVGEEPLRGLMRRARDFETVGRELQQNVESGTKLLEELQKAILSLKPIEGQLKALSQEMGSWRVEVEDAFRTLDQLMSERTGGGGTEGEGESSQ